MRLYNIIAQYRLIAYKIPIVDTKLSENASSAKRISKLDFPTSVSPIRTSLNETTSIL